MRQAVFTQENKAMDFRELLDRDGTLVYKNRGDSMLPLIREGRDLLIIEKIRAPLRKYDIPLYQRDSGEYVLHRILQIRPDGYVLCGDNRWKREYGISDRNMVGVLRSVVRDGREISLNSRRFRLYTHLWCDLFPIRAAILIVGSLPGKIRRRCIK